MIEWQEPREPDETCSYNYLVGRTPFGDILITWKSWKDYPNFVVEEPDWLSHRYYLASSIDEVKVWCETKYEEIVRAAYADLREGEKNG